MSPFDAMAKVLAVPPKLAPRAPAGGSLTKALLAALSDGNKRTTAELAAFIGAEHSKHVWGLLKDQRKRGEVLCTAGIWSMNPNYLTKQVAAAADLLRQHGWKVEPPKC